ncbi:MAG: trigger factor [Bdellovibrio sp.]|nr:MAG: trigger factor [Bdellovibrio sp.]
MKSSYSNLEQLKRKLEVQIPAASVAESFEQAFREIQKDAHIKGFRPGKAPLATIRNLYGEKVKQSVVQDLIERHYARALMEHSLDPITYPEFEFDVPVAGEDFSFTAFFEVRPAVELKKYQGLEFETEKLELDEKRIDAVIENIRSAHATWIDVLENRPAQGDDQAIIDFTGFVDGQPLDKGQGTDFALVIGSKRFIEGFEEGLVGMNVGEDRVLRLKFPTPYTSAELAGKDVEFRVRLKALKKKVLPELTPEFLNQQLAGIESETKLRETIRADLMQSEQKRIENDTRNRLLRLLVQNNPVEAPAAMVHEQKDRLIADVKQRMTAEQMGENEFQTYATRWDKDFEGTAREIVQSSFIVDAIARKHELSATREDVERRLTEYSAQTGIPMERMREFYAKPEQAERLNYMITEEKVLDFVKKASHVREVPKEKLTELG